VKKRIRNLLIFAIAIILLLVIINIIDHALLLNYRDKYVDLEAVKYSVYLGAIIEEFHDEYHQWPGPSGPIDDAFICELGGFPTAKINVKHINFYKNSNMEILKKDKFGYYFRFEIDGKDPLGFRVVSLSPDPRTGLPIEQAP
jgi:hypothetical protein